jgi:predicted nuclease of predicted toxin-antitoxin system
MKFLVDMNLSPDWVKFLAESDFEAVHWSDVGPGDALDIELMRWAAEHDHIVLTADLDFGALLAVVRHKRPSVVQLRSDNLSPSVIGEAALAAIRQSKEELLAGALMSVDIARARLRILPLGS